MNLISLEVKTKRQFKRPFPWGLDTTDKGLINEKQKIPVHCITVLSGSQYTLLASFQNCKGQTFHARFVVHEINKFIFKK